MDVDSALSESTGLDKYMEQLRKKTKKRTVRTGKIKTSNTSKSSKKGVGHKSTKKNKKKSLRTDDDDNNEDGEEMARIKKKKRRLALEEDDRNSKKSKLSESPLNQNIGHHQKRKRGKSSSSSSSHYGSGGNESDISESINSREESDSDDNNASRNRTKKSKRRKDFSGGGVSSSSSSSGELNYSSVLSTSVAVPVPEKHRDAMAHLLQSSTPSLTRKRELCFYDDEGFNFDDNITRRQVYKPMRTPSLLFRDIRRLLVFNFTASQFLPGATQWYHLNDKSYKVFASIFNAISYATGKKMKHLPPEKLKPKTHAGNNTKWSRNKRDSVDDLGATLDQETGQEPEIEKFIRGNNDITVLVETLLKQGNIVAGFRFWIIDRSIPKDETDIISQGLTESLIDAAQIQVLSGNQLEALEKDFSRNGGTTGKKRRTEKRIYKTAKEFSFSSCTTMAKHFEELIMPYLTDDQCYISNAETLNGICVAKAGVSVDRLERCYTNSSNFTHYVHNRDNVPSSSVAGGADAYTKLNHPCHLTNILTKEAAMYCHVSGEKINDAQCQLQSYISHAPPMRHSAIRKNVITSSSSGGGGGGNNDVMDELEDIDDQMIILDTITEERRSTAARDDSDDLTQIIELPDAGSQSGIRDRECSGEFPHPNVVYLIANSDASLEFLSRVPTPHRIGTALYTGKDEETLQSLLHKEGDSDRSGIGMNSAKEIMGLHDTEYELTTETLLSQIRHVDPVDRVDIAKSVIPSSFVVNRFIQNKNIEIHTRLDLIRRNIGIDGRIVLCEKNMSALRNTVSGGGGGHKNSAMEFSSNLANILNINATAQYAQMSCVLGQCDGGGVDSSFFSSVRVVNPLDAIMKGRVGETGGGSGSGNNNEEGTDGSSTVCAAKIGVDLSIDKQPYVAESLPGRVNNVDKSETLRHRALAYRRLNGTMTDEDRLALLDEAIVDYECKIASGNPGFFRDFMVKYRPYGSSLAMLKHNLPNVQVDDVFLMRDIFLRLSELNKEARLNVFREFIDPVTGQIPLEKEQAFLYTISRLVDAATVECWHELFTSPAVSLACEGIRSDLLKQHTPYMNPEKISQMAFNNVAAAAANTMPRRRTIGRRLPVYEYTHDVRTYAAFRIYLSGLISDQGGITYNYKIISVLYFSKLHHCRWYPQCNNPKLNILLSGYGMAGKSKALQFTKATCPTGVGDMVTHITDQAFNVDRNLNDILLIYEEFQNKYLGYSSNGSSSTSKNNNTGGGGGGGGLSNADTKDTTNFFKSRLTSGMTQVFSWFENEETGLRDMKISQAHCQGNLLAATNNDLTEADMNVLSRIIVMSVAKSRHALRGYRAQDRNKTVAGRDAALDNEMFEEHKEIHRVYYIIEQMIKSGVLGDDIYGVNIDNAREMIIQILDRLQSKYGIPTNDVRKIEYVIEMARCMLIAEKCWFVLTSTLTRYLQYDPRFKDVDACAMGLPEAEPYFIGLNPRVILAIIQFLVMTKDHVIDAVTALSCLWYHDYQDLILRVFSTEKCKLQQLDPNAFLTTKRRSSTNTGNNNNNNRRGGDYTTATHQFTYVGNDRNSGRGDSAATTTTRKRSRPGAADDDDDSNNNNNNTTGTESSPHQQQQQQHKARKIVDYNYIQLSSKNQMEIFDSLSQSLGDLVVSANDIMKLFSDLSRSWIQDLPGYILKEVDGKKCLVRSENPADKTQRRVVRIYRDPETGKHVVAVLVHFLKQKLPGLFPDNTIEDLDSEMKVRLKEKEAVDENGEAGTEDPDDEAGEEEEEEEGDVTEADVTNADGSLVKEYYYRRIRAIGLIQKKSEGAIIKAIRDIIESPVLEYTGMEKKEEKALRESYMNPSTGRVPWESYITADPPKSVYISEFHPEMKTKLGSIKQENKGEILFVDKHLMMDMKRKEDALPMVVNNYNMVAPSVSRNLSIYNKNSTNPAGVIRKKRTREYLSTDAWNVDLDPDFISAVDHYNNIGYRTLKTAPEFKFINYPPSTYMAVVNHRERLAKRRDAINGGKTKHQEEPLIEYPFVDNMIRISNKKKRMENEIDPRNAKRNKMSHYVASNFTEGGAVHNLCTGVEKAYLGPTIQRCIETEKKRLFDQYEALEVVF